MAPFGPNLAHFDPKFPKTEVFCIFFRKKSQKIYFFISLVEIWLVQLKLKFFGKKSRFAHFGQKLSKIGLFGPKCSKMEVFPFLSQSVRQNFLIFCTKPSLWSRKKTTVSLFWRKFKNDPFWRKLTQIWPYLAISGLKPGC